MESLVTLDDVDERLPFELDDDERREATNTIESLSDDARHYGSSAWTEHGNTPRSVRNLILRAATRHLKNPDGYTQSRAGDETLAWTDRGHDSGSAYFTAREVEMLRTIAGRITEKLHSVPVFVATSAEFADASTVPTQGGSPIPYFNGSEPW